MNKKSVEEVTAESLVGLSILWYSKTVSYRCYKGTKSLGQNTSTKDGEVCQRPQPCLLMRSFREPPDTCAVEVIWFYVIIFNQSVLKS